MHGTTNIKQACSITTVMGQAINHIKKKTLALYERQLVSLRVGISNVPEAVRSVLVSGIKLYTI